MPYIEALNVELFDVIQHASYLLGMRIITCGQKPPWINNNQDESLYLNKSTLLIQSSKMVALIIKASHSMLNHTLSHFKFTNSNTGY